MKIPSPLLGCAVGDALGCPFEVANDQPLLHPRLEGWNGDFLSTRGGWHDLEPGQWSDDTQFSVALAEAMLAREFAGVRYRDLYLSGVRGIGGRQSSRWRISQKASTRPGSWAPKVTARPCARVPSGFFIETDPWMPSRQSPDRTPASRTIRSKHRKLPAVAVMTAVLSRDDDGPIDCSDLACAVLRLHVC